VSRYREALQGVGIHTIVERPCHDNARAYLPRNCESPSTDSSQRRRRVQDHGEAYDSVRRLVKHREPKRDAFIHLDHDFGKRFKPDFG
jgi:hypothetical protein